MMREYLKHAFVFFTEPQNLEDIPKNVPKALKAIPK